MGLEEYYAVIEKDPKNKKLYFAIRKEVKNHGNFSDMMQITIVEREGHVKPGKSGSGFRDERPYTFKGDLAAAHAARYLIEKYHLNNSDLSGEP
jgi:hypothetical protein